MTTLNATPDQKPAGETPAGAQSATETATAAFDFDAWLQSQPEETRSGLAAHLNGLQTTLQKERDARKALEKAQKDAEKAKKDAETASLAEQQKWEPLAKQLQTRIGEHENTIAGLQEQATKAERYEKALKAQLDVARAGLPAHIIALLDKLDTADQLEYIAANAEALKVKPVSQIPPPPTPPANGDGKLPPAEQREKAFKIRSF
jgi:phage shock protein A